MSFGRLLLLTLVAAVGAAGLRVFAIEGIYVASASMEPTLSVGTHLFLDKATLWFAEPERGDIVVLAAPVPGHDEVVKRVIAVGGDRVEMRNKRVYVDGKPLDEPYVQYTRETEKLAGDSFPEERVPKGYLFVLGDNRDESNDASTWKDDEGEPIRFILVSRVRGYVRGAY